MMHFRRISLFTILLALGALGLSSCSTDLDPNADYRETMVIYSILNPAERVHYARISKAFINPNADARDIALNRPDSTTYADILNVRLQKLNPDSSIIAEYPMVRIDTTGKETGTFFSGSQVLYRTQPGNPGPLDETAIYRISVLNTVSGVTASGATELVMENANINRRFCVVQVNFPVSGVPCLDSTRAYDYNPQFPHAVIFRVPGNGAIYNLKMTFNYTETIGNVTENKKVEWYLRNNFLSDVTPNSLIPEIRVPVDEMAFYQTIKNLITTNNQDPNLSRLPGDIYLTVTAGSQSLATNFLVNNSFSVFSQTRPEFNNISNGTGLVGSRLQKVVKLQLTNNARIVLRTNPDFTGLKFQ